MGLGQLVMIKDQQRLIMRQKRVSIRGGQDGYVVDFGVIQVFEHSEAKACELRYVLPDEFGVCIYNFAFIVGYDVIEPPVTEKKEVYQRADFATHYSTPESSLGYGVTEFSLGLVEPGVECFVKFKIALTATTISDQATIFKLPLEYCIQNGFVGCSGLEHETDFDFYFRHCNPNYVYQIATNLDGAYEQIDCSFASNVPPNVDFIIVTSKLSHPLRSYAIADSGVMAISVFPEAVSDQTASEFVFLIDCSGSMSGGRIEQARKCLSLFLRSLPHGSFYNVIKFGSNYVQLWERSVELTEETFGVGLQAIGSINATMGGTSIYAPLESIFKDRIVGVRQIFVITDGEVNNTSRVLELVRQNRRENRLFCIGIGGADEGLVNGMATCSGGMSCFVDGSTDGQFEAAILQMLAISRRPVMVNTSLQTGQHLVTFSGGTLGPIPTGVVSTIFVAGTDTFTDSPISITGEFGDQHVQIEISQFSRGSPCIHALYAHQRITHLISVHRTEYGFKESKIFEEILSLCKRNNILCRYTTLSGSTGNPPPQMKTVRRCEYLSSGGPITLIYRDVVIPYVPPVDHKLMKVLAGSCTKRIDKQIMTTILSHSEFDGSWRSSDPFSDSFTICISDLPDIAFTSDQDRSKIIATVFALAVLRKYYMAEHATWSMIAAKATRWLASMMCQSEYEHLIEYSMHHIDIVHHPTNLSIFAKIKILLGF